MTNEQLNKEAERLINEFQLKAHAMRITAIQCAIIHCDSVMNILNSLNKPDHTVFRLNEGMNGDELWEHYQQLKQTLTNKLK